MVGGSGEAPRGEAPIGAAGLRTRLTPPSVAMLLVLLALTATEAALVWGYTTTFWGDYGMWLHQMERYARGEVPYRDFYFAAPPLSIWLVGSLAKVVGTDLPSTFAITIAIFGAIMIAYWCYVVLLVPARLVPAVVLSGFFLAVAYATIESAPLALGMYKPAVPIGFLCLVIALVVAVPFTTGGGLWRAGVLGALAALCVLAKQDFWLPALVLVVGVCWVRLATARDRRGVTTLLAAFAVTIAGAATVVAASAGLRALIVVATGYQAQYVLARALPSWRLLTIEIIAGLLLGIGLLGALWLTSLRIARITPAAIALALALVLVTALYVHFEDAAGWNLTTLRLLRNAVYWHLFPVLLPVLVVVLAVRGDAARRPARLRVALILLGMVCVAARVRRGFEHVDWYQLLLELPLYVLAIEFFFGREARSAAMLMVFGLGVVGANVYYRYGVGPLSYDGPRARTITPRGAARWDPWNAQEFESVQALLDTVDPSGRRSVFQFGGHNGTLNYFLERPSTTSIVEGFVYAVVDPNRALAELLQSDPPLLLVYDHMYDTLRTPQARIAWTQWDKTTEPDRRAEHDQPYFDRLKEGCSPITLWTSPAPFGHRWRWPELTVQWRLGDARIQSDNPQPAPDSRPRFTVYDCAHTADLDRIVARVNSRLPQE